MCSTLLLQPLRLQAHPPVSHFIFIFLKEKLQIFQRCSLQQYPQRCWQIISCAKHQRSAAAARSALSSTQQILPSSLLFHHHNKQHSAISNVKSHHAPEPIIMPCVDSVVMLLQDRFEPSREQQCSTDRRQIAPAEPLQRRVCTRSITSRHHNFAVESQQLEGL